MRINVINDKFNVILNEQQERERILSRELFFSITMTFQNVNFDWEISVARLVTVVTRIKLENRCLQK